MNHRFIINPDFVYLINPDFFNISGIVILCNVCCVKPVNNKLSWQNNSNFSNLLTTFGTQ